MDDAVQGGSSDLTVEEDVGVRLGGKGLTLAVAESCTGGFLGARLTSVSGSSSYFLGGVIAYSDAVKVEMLGIERALMEKDGAVSAAVAGEMAVGVRDRLKADIGVAITGIAGPGGGSREKPVGLVFVGLASGDRCEVRRFFFSGDRDEVRRQSCDAALQMVKERVAGKE